MGLATNDKGEVLVNEHFETNIPNCYAIGDLIPDIKQVGIAQAHGIKLAYYLLDQVKEVK